MRRLLATSRRLLAWLSVVEYVFAGAILVGIVLVINGQVLLNAGLGDPIAWEQEGGAYALVWLTFIGASLGMKQQRHIAIATGVGRLPPRGAAAVRLLVLGIVIWVLLSILRELTGIIPIEGRAQTIALPFDAPRSWFFSVPLAVSSTLLLWTSCHYFAEHLLRLLSGDASPVAPIIPGDAIE